MMRIGRTLGRASKLIRPSQSGFCVFRGYLDPHRHNTMNHNPHNVYIDLWDVGQYPEVVDMSSKPSRLYEPIVIDIAVEVFNNAYVKCGLLSLESTSMLRGSIVKATDQLMNF